MRRPKLANPAQSLKSRGVDNHDLDRHQQDVSMDRISDHLPWFGSSSAILSPHGLLPICAVVSGQDMTGNCYLPLDTRQAIAPGEWFASHSLSGKDAANCHRSPLISVFTSMRI